MIKKIMLVDDMEIANIIIKKMLRLSKINIEIFDFTNSHTALECIDTLMPDLIFLDLNMPLLDGWEFLLKMKEYNYTNKVIILTSSISMLDEKRAGEFSNVIDYCHKPIKKEKLINYINNLKEEIIN